MRGKNLQFLPDSHRIIVNSQHLQITHKTSGDGESSDSAWGFDDADKLNTFSYSDELKIMIVESLVWYDRLKEGNNFDCVVLVWLG